MYRLVYCGTLPPEVGTGFQPVSALAALQPGHTITFGRASDNDVCLAVTDLPPSCETSKTAVSRHHAQLSLEAGSGALFLRDLSTINGTYVNGSRLPPNRDFLVPLDAHGRAELIFGGNSAVQEGESPEEYARKGKLILRSFAFFLERAGPPGGGAQAADAAAAAEQAAAAARQLLATTGTLVSAAADAGEGRAGRAGPAGGSGSGSKRGSGSGSGSGSSSKASPEPLDRGEGASAGALVSAATTAAVALAGASAAAAAEAAEARAADDAEDSDGMATEMEGESQRAHAASRIPSGAGAAAAEGAGAGAPSSSSSSSSSAAADSTSPLKRHKSSGHYMELKARVVSISQRMGEVQAQVAQLSAELQGLVKDLQ